MTQKRVDDDDDDDGDGVREVTSRSQLTRVSLAQEDC